jgi:1-acyl-sn-glycerol-3-phosphate acyltransferase
MSEMGPSTEFQAATAPGESTERGGWRLLRIPARLATAILDLALTKPMAIFVWWLSNRANAMRFRERGELHRRVRRAVRAGRPVLFASNHVSMFDDPVVPMALFRMGPRAAAELAVLALLLALCWAVPDALLPPALPLLAALGWAAAITFFGTGKEWWSLGDLVNFSGAAALRGKLESGSDRPLSRLHRVLLAVADPAIYYFMRSRVVKTVFVDRRAGEAAKSARERAVALTIEIAARAEPVWIFFEGGRSGDPREIGPARKGIGAVILGLRERGLDPLVVAIYQRGTERVIPRGSSRWLTTGHRIDVRWSECVLDRWDDGERERRDPQVIADAVRAQVVQLLHSERTGNERDA